MNDSALEREISSGKPVVTMTWGDSMEPLLFHQSTRVVIRKVEGDLKKGDLPVYRRPSGQFVMHRIVGVRKDCYETRGDNRFGVEQVPREWVQGVVTEIYRKEKHILVTDWRYRLWPLRKFCVSVLRQSQEYHIINVHDWGLFPLATAFPGGWDGMRAGTA